MRGAAPPTRFQRASNAREAWPPSTRKANTEARCQRTAPSHHERDITMNALHRLGRPVCLAEAQASHAAKTARAAPAAHQVAGVPRSPFFVATTNDRQAPAMYRTVSPLKSWESRMAIIPAREIGR